MKYGSCNIGIFVVFCFGIGIRGIISLSSYSGASSPPMFGDYEAQRHWQEITLNIPANQWYLNTSDNDLHYWGIDYPPLTAYHSLFLSVIANRINSSYVALLQSRGYESSEHKSFMRLSVLVADIFIYIPAAILVIISVKQYSSAEKCIPSLILLILYPGQILIDNGHFQYNNISLGLFAFSVALILKDRNNWASLVFSLALNYKQMELYHALPFFVYLLKASFSEKSFLKNIFNLIQVGFITVLTFFIIWIPWTSSLDSLMAAVLRLFPLSRGVFEDKVANVWCSLNVIYKIKNNVQNGQMALICLIATLLAILPTNVHLFFDFQKKTFLYTLVNTSISFFLLSFQVHEKSILLAAIPVAFIFNTVPFGVLCFLKLSVLSMFPLLIKDNLCVLYFSITIVYVIIFKSLVKLEYSKDKKVNNILVHLMNILDITILITSTVTLYITPPKHLPYLWPFVISFFCCIFFIIFLLASNLLQCNYLFINYKKHKILKQFRQTNY